ncbi:MAG: carbon starvation protein A, partial [Candidatus Brocadiales bacterium]
AGVFYSRHLSRVFGLDPKGITPAVKNCDGRDYVPTRTPIVFAHHFASIAAAGPILGPTLALIYGWGPAWLWIVLGGIFFGAVHDFSAIFVSLKEEGCSIAEIAKKTLGLSGFLMVVAFSICMLLLVNATFLNATSMALTSMLSLEQLGMKSASIQTPYPLRGEGGVGVDATLPPLRPEDGGFSTLKGGGDNERRKPYGLFRIKGDNVQIGGIASMSAIIVTAFAPLIGFLHYKRGLSVFFSSPIAMAICVLSVFIGLVQPVSLPPLVWMIILSIYTLLAAGIPVWILLQPRDFINVHLLFAGIVLLMVGVCSANLNGGHVRFPSHNISEGTATVGLIWPGIFITIACGAISGFHALCGTGTTSKQLKSQGASRTVGYYAMLLESLMACAVLGTVIVGLDFAEYKELVYPIDGKQSNPILAFALAMGQSLHQGIHLPIVFGVIFGMLLLEGFLVTSLDVAVRLNRYLFEELWQVFWPASASGPEPNMVQGGGKRPPRFLMHHWFNAALSVGLMFLLAYYNTVATIWTIFGTANQLLASLTLMVISFWLLNNGRRVWYTLIPACFMLVTTFTMLILLMIGRYIPEQNVSLILADGVLLGLAAGMIFKLVSTLVAVKGRRSSGFSPQS